MGALMLDTMAPGVGCVQIPVGRSVFLVATRNDHTLDLLRPSETVTCLSDLASQSYDAYVLKTVSNGPGLSILQAAEAVGVPAINNSRSISFGVVPWGETNGQDPQIRLCSL